MYAKAMLDRFADTLDYPEEHTFRAAVGTLTFGGPQQLCTGGALDAALTQVGLQNPAETFHQRYLDFTELRDVVAPQEIALLEPKDPDPRRTVVSGL